jgi:hypothetical protein
MVDGTSNTGKSGTGGPDDVTHTTNFSTELNIGPVFKVQINEEINPHTQNPQNQLKTSEALHTKAALGFKQELEIK